MSDEEYDQEGWGSDAGSDQPEDDDDGVVVQNNFYEGEAIWRDKNYEAAKEKFDVVVDLSESMGIEQEMGFKATKYLVLINMIIG
jgi:hypothetical protein